MKKPILTKLLGFIFTLTILLTLSTPLAAAVQDAPPPATDEAAAQQTDDAAVIAEFKAEIIRLVNLERAEHGVAALEYMEPLCGIADIRAEESSVTFRHVRPDGSRCFTIFKENNLFYRFAGENLAYGYKTAEEFVAAWMDSESHRSNILDPDFQYIGIGYFVSDSGKIYCSQLFYTPKDVI